jgi:hypothetical protein
MQGVHVVGSRADRSHRICMAHSDLLHRGHADDPRLPLSTHPYPFSCYGTVIRPLRSRTTNWRGPDSLYTHKVPD